ncbi:MAG: GTPase, partial [Candidatus Woesearchaeota archaeon]
RNVTPFYIELIKCFVDYNELKKSLGSINWVIENTKKISRDSLHKIRAANTVEEVRKIKNAYFGRISSIMNQADKYLVFLENARRIFRNFPDVKNLPTVCIVGFPNIGKTTLLSKLTGAKAKIAPYAFTTLGINAGYKEIRFQKIQFLDTPGTLNRFDKMNIFEKQAVIALKYLANIIVYVFDLTEPYPLEQQEQLYKEILKHNKPTLIYLSKTDIVPQKKIDAFRLKYNFVSDVADLEKEITKIVFKR